MKSSPPIKMSWQGDDGFMPASPYWQVESDKAFKIGKVYFVTVLAERSEASHNHLFSVLDDAWHSLPDALMPVFPTKEHFRKKGLVAIGYFNEAMHVCSSNAEASRLATTFRNLDEYVVVNVREKVVQVLTARSLSRNAIPDNREWQEIKDKLLNWAAAQINVPPAQLARQGNNA